jgi:site-specific DNA-methyltransferase (adenine-specific)
MRYTLHHGDNREVLRTMPDNSVDSIVTDPPYELGFMGKKWDSTGIAYDQTLWAECLRVLKPGGHLIAFGGTRTYHRMTCAIEDAGFEIRDCIQWIYGSGFPKSLDVSKAIDKQAGAEREVVGKGKPMRSLGVMHDDKWISDAEYALTAPHLPTAQQWHGFGTALKPANEPAVLARKPLSGTVADNVLTWGVGGLNIDGCRVEGSDSDINARKQKTIKDKLADKQIYNDGWYGSGAGWSASTGRWPANVILDEEAAQMLDAQSGHDASRFFYVAKASRAEREAGLDGMKVQIAQSTGMSGDSMPLRQNGTERKTPMRANHHPTVKPITLMRYLVRLVTPPGGTVLDPFMGSGSTGCAAMLEAMQFIGIELSAEYLEIARRRIEFHEYTVREKNPMGL